MGIEAVFIDRDGVLNRYVKDDYIRTPDEVHLIEGSARAVRLLNDAELPVIVISNQQGVGKRIMTEDALDQVDGEIRDQLLTASNAKLTHVYYCVHLASDNCDCRKPKPGMLLQAADEHGIDLANSVMIGDSLGDIATGIAAGVAETILLMSGATSIISPTALEARMRPTLIARDLLGAVKHLLENLDK